MTCRITKEEAIKELNYYRHCLDFQFGWFGEYDNEVIDMAIKALQTEGAQGVGRYENAMQKLREMPKYLNGIKEKQIKKTSVEGAQGEWIKTINGNGWNEWSVLKCPLCGAIIEDKQYHSWGYNYCPSCGKRIRGGDTE